MLEHLTDYGVLQHGVGKQLVSEGVGAGRVCARPAFFILNPEDSTVSYMKRFVEDVMESMGKDNIDDEVLAEAQRRLDAHKEEEDSVAGSISGIPSRLEAKMANRVI